ncbi:MAG: hypothetical protein A4E57_02210 [Syntrophorhabdaceae bacterium PtaU1.Bin034]|nr:MAG: hypothetical protein A4E57_02210 [Syntrophorhabdaceae bacterium PtaU1.Bin034]
MIITVAKSSCFSVLSEDHVIGVCLPASDVLFSKKIKIILDMKEPIMIIIIIIMTIR